jgi:ATP-binding cassette subfamily B (MDR/TAP) protein 1
MSSSSDNGAGPEAGGKKKKKKAAEEEAAAKVPFLKLFSFADRWDCVLMAVGSLGACAHGASVPVFFIFFGKLINIIGLAYLFPTTVSGRVAKVTAPARAWRI